MAARPGHDDGAGCPRPGVRLSLHLFLTTAIRSRRPVVARADDSRATDGDLSQRGISSVHAQPLIQDDAVVGVLTVEPASIDELLAVACRQLTELEDVARAAIFLSAQDRPPHAPPPETLSLDEKVLRTRHAVVTGRGSVTAVPLTPARHVVGVLVVDGAREPALPGDVRRLAAAAARHLGAVIDVLRARRRGRCTGCSGTTAVGRTPGSCPCPQDDPDRC